MDGIINLYKPQGLTSHDVVARVRRLLKTKKVGHTGTLDPEATGVLPICIGKGTKVVDLLTDKDKSYRCEMTLGVTTTTEDHTGEVVEIRPIDVSTEEIKQAIYSFVGPYSQIPPMYSALKVNGKKLYEYARQGIVIERKARQVFIHEIKILDITLPNKVVFDVTCSKGTYIRTLCVDIGEKLGCGAHMSALERISVGEFNKADSITLEKLEEIVHQQNVEQIIYPIEYLFKEYAKILVKEEANKYLYNGNELLYKNLRKGISLQQDCIYRVYDSTSNFVGIYRCILKENELCIKPVKLFI